MLFIHRVRQSGPLQTGPGGGGGAGGAHSPIDTSAVRTPSAPGGPTVAITATPSVGAAPLTDFSESTQAPKVWGAAPVWGAIAKDSTYIYIYATYRSKTQHTCY